MKMKWIPVLIGFVLLLTSCQSEACVEYGCYTLNSEDIPEFLEEHNISGTAASNDDISWGLHQLEKYRRWYSIESEFTIHFLHYELVPFVSEEDSWNALYDDLTIRSITQAFAVKRTLINDALYTIVEQQYFVYENEHGDVSFGIYNGSYFIASIDSKTGLAYVNGNKDQLIQRSPKTIVSLQNNEFDTDELDINLVGDDLYAEVFPNTTIHFDHDEYEYGFFHYDLEASSMLSLQIIDSKVVITIIHENTFKNLKSSLIGEFDVTTVSEFIANYKDYIIPETLMEEEHMYFAQIQGRYLEYIENAND